MFFTTKKMTAIFSAVIFFVALDRLLKVLAEQGFKLNLVGEILKFNFKANYFIAFSLPLAGAWLNAAITAVILLLVYYLIASGRRGERAAALSLSAVILGAAGNLFDRLKYGYVVDYLDLKYFTAFNLADVMIVAGVGLLLMRAYKKQVIR